MPKNTPAEIVGKLNEVSPASPWIGALLCGRALSRAQIAGWFTAALQAPEIRSKLVGLDHNPVGMCGAEFGALVRKQFEDYGRVFREGHIKAE